MPLQRQVPMSSRKFDVVVLGATGFSGKLLAEYLTSNYGVDKFAIAGRNRTKLQQVKEDLTQRVPQAASLTILICDSADGPSLTAIAEQTRVIASTVGPYGKYGTPLVEVCARTGTSYCDLTGESDWHSLMYNRFERLAKDSGARIVHQAGFDSVPSDVGTYLASRAFTEQFGHDCARVDAFVSLRGGGVQGGTIDLV